MLLNRISPRLAAGIGAAGLTAGAVFAATVYFGGADAGDVTGAAVQQPPQAGGEDFFAGVDGLSEDERDQRREEARKRAEEAQGAAGAAGTARPAEKEEPEEEEESSDEGASGSASGGDTSADADSLNWPALAQCESGGDPTAVNSAGGYYGLYQFSMTTWESVGGSGSPAEAPASEQTMRAKMLYDAVGGNWQSQWPECGRHLHD
ncbi:transglycosylase family protein [Nocardiopsis halophila]|uniref:transglycosylase family protein n=1 Tax=Nocardiopsis halophila TaxID=141692 RepID=UPI0003489BB7|nr:transglycosylase family protein [Nocardiopsis halophila]